MGLVFGESVVGLITESVPCAALIVMLDQYRLALELSLPAMLADRNLERIEAPEVATDAIGFV
jgi:hypothetical protein